MLSVNFCERQELLRFPAIVNLNNIYFLFTKINLPPTSMYYIDRGCMTSVVELHSSSRQMFHILIQLYEHQHFWNSDHVFRKRMGIIYNSRYNSNNNICVV